jgi:hypothetical protein
MHQFKVGDLVRAEHYGAMYDGWIGEVAKLGDREGWPACSVQFEGGKSFLIAERFLRRVDDSQVSR